MKRHWKALNDRFAEKITKAVGTMTCAYLFAVIAMIALPQAIFDSFTPDGIHPLPLITWLSQSFLQLVLLAIISVGQDVVGRAAEVRANTQFDAVMETLRDMRLLMTEEDSIVKSETQEVADLDQIVTHLVRIEKLIKPARKPRSKKTT